MGAAPTRGFNTRARKKKNNKTLRGGKMCAEKEIAYLKKIPRKNRGLVSRNCGETSMTH